MLDDEATDLLRRHLRRAGGSGSVVVDRGDLEREIGEVRTRDLDGWVAANGGILLPVVDGAQWDYEVPRALFEEDDSPRGEEPRNSL